MSDTQFTPDDVKKIAKLAHISLTKLEEQTLASQLGDIVGYISQLQKVNTQNIEPTSQVTGLENVFREDEIAPTGILTQEQALANAPDSYNGFIRVPAILDE